MQQNSLHEQSTKTVLMNNLLEHPTSTKLCYTLTKYVIMNKKDLWGNPNKDGMDIILENVEDFSLATEGNGDWTVWTPVGFLPPGVIQKCLE